MLSNIRSMMHHELLPQAIPKDCCWHGSNLFFRIDRVKQMLLQASLGLLCFILLILML